MSIFKSLRRDQKETIGLLQVGTFLEYFDLMLYVHMAVLLNEIFFPPSDPSSAALISASAFCATYVFRPIGAVIFGWIGDNIGRKTTVILTTFMMSISCVIMANLPTYADIGIAAGWIMMSCRILQGMSSMGEIMGAEIYITEMTKPPLQYPATALVAFASTIGTTVALGVATLVTQYEMNWRIAFWVGAGVAVVGSLARTRLRETPEFVSARRVLRRSVEMRGYPQEILKQKGKKIKEIVEQEKVNAITILACFCAYCGWPLTFYMTFMGFNPFLKEYGYSSQDIIFHNFLLSTFIILMYGIYVALSYRIHPLKILKVKGWCFFVFSLFLPFFVMKAQTSFDITCIQVALVFLNLSVTPAEASFIKHFPILRRFRSVSMVYAVTRAIMCMITSFGLVLLTQWFGHYGLWIAVPVGIAYLWGIHYFQHLEKFTLNRETDDVIFERAMNLVY